MTDFDFTPGAVTIARGDTVTWSNGGAAPHDAVGNGWGTSLLLAGQSGSITFQTAGTFAYTCSIHSQMNGTVVVQAASGGGGGGPVATDPPTDTAPAVVTSGGGVPLGGAAAVIVGAAALAGFAAVARRSRHTA